MSKALAEAILDAAKIIKRMDAEIAQLKQRNAELEKGMKVDEVYDKFISEQFLSEHPELVEKILFDAWKNGYYSNSMEKWAAFKQDYINSLKK